MKVTTAAAVFSILAGVGIPLLWAALLLGGRITDLSERPLSYAFHWTAEGLTATFLLVSGIGAFRHVTHARPVYFAASGMLIVAAAGMSVYYLLLHQPLFVLSGAVFASVAGFFLVKNRPAFPDLTLSAAGAVVYVLLTASGNALDAGDRLSAVYLLAALAALLPFSVAAFRRLS